MHVGASACVAHEGTREATGAPSTKTSNAAPSERTPVLAGRIAQVVRFVVAHPGCSLADVQKSIGENLRTTSRAVADAVREGSIVRIGGGPKTRYRAAGARG